MDITDHQWQSDADAGKAATMFLISVLCRALYFGTLIIARFVKTKIYHHN
jgi:hypothetical protein